jgi:hypothetical protein
LSECKFTMRGRSVGFNTPNASGTLPVRAEPGRAVAGQSGNPGKKRR